jgi:hypothetical protein
MQGGLERFQKCPRAIQQFVLPGAHQQNCFEQRRELVARRNSEEANAVVFAILAQDDDGGNLVHAKLLGHCFVGHEIVHVQADQVGKLGHFLGDLARFPAIGAFEVLGEQLQRHWRLESLQQVANLLLDLLIHERHDNHPYCAVYAVHPLDALLPDWLRQSTLIIPEITLCF